MESQSRPHHATVGLPSSGRLATIKTLKACWKKEHEQGGREERARRNHCLPPFPLSAPLFPELHQQPTQGAFLPFILCCSSNSHCSISSQCQISHHNGIICSAFASSHKPVTSHVYFNYTRVLNKCIFIEFCFFSLKKSGCCRITSWRDCQMMRHGTFPIFYPCKASCTYTHTQTWVNNATWLNAAPNNQSSGHPLAPKFLALTAALVWSNTEILQACTASLMLLDWQVSQPDGVTTDHDSIWKPCGNEQKTAGLGEHFQWAVKQDHFTSIPASLSLPLFPGVLHHPPALWSPQLMSVWWHNCLICGVSFIV